jgi:hypothetical protein
MFLHNFVFFVNKSFLPTTFIGILANTCSFFEFIFSEAIVSYTIAFSKIKSEKGPVLDYLLIKVQGENEFSHFTQVSFFS